MGRDEHVAVVADRRSIVDAPAGLEPRPLDRQPMVASTRDRRRGRSPRHTGAEPVALTRKGACPVRSQSHQSDDAAAPSHWVDDAPVPHQKPSGHCTTRSMARGSAGRRTETGNCRFAPPPHPSHGHPTAPGAAAQTCAYDQLTHVLVMNWARPQGVHRWRGHPPVDGIDGIRKGGPWVSRRSTSSTGANFVDGVPHDWFRQLRRRGARVLAPRSVGPPGRVLGRHRLRRLRHREPGLGALLVGQALRPLRRHGRGAAGPAAADDAQHGPDHAHPVPPAGQQGLHPEAGA